jgi:hypothetical protein
VFELAIGLLPLAAFDLVAGSLPHKHILIDSPTYQKLQPVHAHKDCFCSSIFFCI